MIQLVDRDAEGDGAGQKGVSGRVKGAEDGSSHQNYYVLLFFLLPWKENTPPRPCLSGTCSRSICSLSIKRRRCASMFLLCVISGSDAAVHRSSVSPLMLRIPLLHFFSHQCGIYSTLHGSLTYFSPFFSLHRSPLCPSSQFFPSVLTWADLGFLFLSAHGSTLWEKRGG